LPRRAALAAGERRNANAMQMQQIYDAAMPGIDNALRAR